LPVKPSWRNYVPPLGDLKDQFRLVLAASCAVVFSGVLQFVWDLITSPARIHARVIKQFQAQHNALNDIVDHERQLRILAALYEEGQTKYQTMLSPEQYQSTTDEWANRVAEVLTEKFSVSDAFKFNDARRNQNVFRIMVGTDTEWQAATHRQRASISGRLDALRDIIEYSTGRAPNYASISQILTEGRDIIARYGKS
jgi:hypothetical protein